MKKEIKMRYCVFMDPNMKKEVDKLCDIIRRDPREIVQYDFDSDLNLSFMVRLFVREGLDKYFEKYGRRK